MGEEVTLDSIDAFRRLRRDQIDSQHPATGFGQIYRNLTPAAGRKAQVHHCHAWLEQPVAVIDLQQLECCTTLEARNLRGLGELIFRLPVYPSLAAVCPDLPQHFTSQVPARAGAALRSHRQTE